MRAIPVLLVSVAASLAAAAPTLAHTGVHPAFAIQHGFAHPLTGLDHVLAMVSAGALAAMIGGRALVVLPLSFLGMMMVGAYLGAAGVGLPAVELGIAASVAVLGGLIATGTRPHLALAAVMTGAFAMFHGYAHGGEMPATAPAAGYFAGFVAAAALLHLAGIGLGAAALRLNAQRLALALRGAGGAIAFVGLVLVMRAV